jgi:uncharacterized membrane protein
MSYRVEYRKDMKGKEVVFACPRCAEELRAPLEEAGDVATCPACQGQLKTPGEAERRQWEEIQARKREVAAEQKRQEHERADAKRREEAERAKIAAARAEMAAAATPVEYASAQTDEDRRKMREQREAADALTRMKQPEGYHGIITGAAVIKACAILSYVVGIVAIFFGVAAMIQYGASGMLAVGAGIGYLFVGAVLNLIASLSLAVRDIAINTHWSVLSRAFPKHASGSSELSQLVEPAAST